MYGSVLNTSLTSNEKKVGPFFFPHKYTMLVEVSVTLVRHFRLAQKSWTEIDIQKIIILENLINLKKVSSVCHLEISGSSTIPIAQFRKLLC